MAIWFEESLYDHIKLRIEVERVVADSVTTFGQRAFIFDTVKHGRVFCLDNVIQCAESDEFYYHEIMAHVPLTSMGNVQSVAIIGGASGAMAREVLKHKNCLHIDMIDIDGENIELCKEFMPKVHQGCFEDPRLRVHVADAYHWMARQAGSYDLIIVDSPDPIGPAEKLFSSDFYAYCRSALKKDGVLVCQAGVPFFQYSTYRKVVDELSSMFHYTGSFNSPVPLFIGGKMNFVWASNHYDLNSCLDTQWERRATEISTQTKHYDLHVHRAALDIMHGVAKSASVDSCLAQGDRGTLAQRGIYA